MPPRPDEASPADGGDAPGWFGKLAALGDFAQRRLSPEWVRACDDWLSQALAASRAALGERWLDTYLTAPLQRFAWAPGVFDTRWWFGVLMPSCDSVGRYFPLVIAHPRQRAPEDRISLDHLELWLDHLGRAAMRTLDDGAATLDELEAALHEAPAWPTPGRRAGASPPAAAALAGPRTLARGASLSAWIADAAASELRTALAGCTLWWSAGAPSSGGVVRIVRGLPRDADFVELLADH
jgi:type VI secretion system protein ImpM